MTSVPSSYESFPVPPPPDSPLPPPSSSADPSPFARLRRFLAGNAASPSLPETSAPTAADARFPTAKQALESALGAAPPSSSSAAAPPGGPGGAAGGTRASRSHSREPPSTRTRGSSSGGAGTGGVAVAGAGGGGVRSSPSGGSASSAAGGVPPRADHPTLPNGQRFVRPLRLSGAPPSVRVSLQNAETSGILSSSVGAGAGSEARFPLGGAESSPTLSEGFPPRAVGAADDPPFLSGAGAGAVGGSPDARKRRLSLTNLAAFPGFKRGRGGAPAGDDDDARSVVSVGTGYKAGLTAYEMMRRLRGEGLSKTYWIKDESARECFQCQATFTTFRRKHHCRICGQIFCINCASHILPRLGHLERVRVCDGCHPTALKHESSRSTLDDAASLSRFRHDPPTPASQQRVGYARAPPPGMYARHSRLSTSSLPDIDDDRFSRASSRPQSPIFEEEGEPHAAASLAMSAAAARSRPHSPKSSIAHAQAQAHLAAAGAGPGAPTSSPAEDGDHRASGAGAGLHSPALSAAAPFRRELGDEEHETADEGVGSGGSEDDAAPRRRSVSGSGLGLGLDLDGHGGALALDASAPAPSPRIRLDSSRPGSAGVLLPPDSPFFPRFDRSTSRISGLLVPLLPAEGDPFDAVGGIDPDVYHADAFRAAEAVDIPLSQAALAHIRRMIAQSLEREGVPHAQAWAPELERLLFDAADRLVTLDEAEGGGALDVHAHVRVKRIPGGRPRDSEFVNGVVFTKNIMHKKMPRELSNPKVMLLSFPLDFNRADGKYLDLDTVLRQEQEYLQNVVARIQNHFPQVLLVEKHVSSRALDLLRARDVAVARNVQRSALDAVARSFGAEIVPSPHALLDSKVGRCARFRVQTFVHREIPGGRKTLLRFEGGGDRQTGCTLVLRGAGMDDLAKVKRIVNMLVLVVYNAKLEGYLLHDERIEVLPALPAPSPARESPPPAEKRASSSPGDDDEKGEDTTATLPSSPPPRSEEATSARIAATLAPYESTALSGSALVRFPPPYPLARMAAEDARVREMRAVREKEETARILEEEAASRAGSISAGSSSASLDWAGSEASYDSLSSLPSVVGSVSSEAAFPLHAPQRQQGHRAEVAVLQQPEELARQTKFAEAEEEHAQHLVAWEAYHRANEDSFDPHEFQQLFVLESLVQVNPAGEPVRLCRPPEVHSIAFYRDGDTTLGQYLKMSGASFRSSEPCPSPSCHEPLRNHQRIFVHDEHVLRVSWEAWNNDVLRGAIGLSADCRHPGCRCGGRLVRAASETARLSFGKFLELSFYPSERLACADDACGHDGQLEHVRHWHYGGVRVAIRMDKVDLRNVVAPPRSVKVRPDRQLELRNAEYEQVFRRSEAFFDSVQARFLAFKYDCIPAERLEECKAALSDFSARCEADRKAIARLLRSTYEHGHDSNGTEMTVVRRVLQEKSHAFDAEWAAFVKRVTPADLPDMRRASTAQLKRIFPEAGLAIAPGQRGASGASLPPAIEVEEHLENSGEAGEKADASGAFEDETQVVRDAEVLIEPRREPALLDPLASSTATVVPDPGATTVSTSPRPPPLSRAGSSFRRSSFGSDFESDSTICADGEPASSAPRATSPFIKRRQLPSVVDETSAAESELEPPIWQRRRAGAVATLVSAYDSGSVGTISRNGTIKSKHSGSPNRPNIRRAQTEKPPALSKPRPRPVAAFSDYDSSYARNVGVSHLMANSYSVAAARPSRIPSRKPLKSLTTDQAVDALGVEDELTGPSLGLGVSISPTSTRPSSRASSRAPSSRAPSRPISPTATRSRPPLGRGVDGAGPVQRPPLKPSSSSRSTIKGKSRSTAQMSESSDAGASRPSSRNVGLSRPTASSASKMTSRRVVSTGTGRHVSNMRRHWDSIAQASEKRQAMRKRARPIITSQPTVQIFESIHDAIKEDSDDEDASSVSDAESGGADDEFDDEQEPPERDEDGKPADRHSPAESVNLRPPVPTPAPSTSAPPAVSSMSDALARSSNGAEPSASHLHPPPLHEHASSPADRSDSNFPSVPPSPLMPDSLTFPRMSEGESSGAERRSIFNAFSSLWNYRNGDFSPLAYPTLATEHVYADNPVLLRDDEPTSIIAHALSSKKYYQAFENANLPRIREGLSRASMGDISGEPTSFATPHESDVAQTIEEILRASTQRSFKLGDVELGDISARCTVFWVEQFEALRRQCGCDKQFIESLSRCLKWDAVGGKSKVDFMKTLDDRFIVKQLSRPEMEVFARFAPAYFQYMADALFQGKPTVLAKVFGIYRISLGKQYRNVEFLVMENLFYGRQLKQIFDLKGSTRNRRAEADNPVLLDENLIETSLKNPFYVREESKQFIKQAIFNDSQFLSDLNVMDYSLVVGVDAVKSELVVGIVDYIRTYTWDKRIESWVKETTFLGGTSKAGGPTVITPKQYKLRFREAIDGYLLLAPTPWLNPKSLLPIQPPPEPPKADAPQTESLANGTANVPVPPPSSYPAPPPSDTSSLVAASLASGM
ncbi:Mitochondrial distribution and morphology protein 12 [Rhodotorula kratochvilovae]